MGYLIVGDGPVNASGLALRKALMKEHPAVGKLELVDYKIDSSFIKGSSSLGYL